MPLARSLFVAAAVALAVSAGTLKAAPSTVPSVSCDSAAMLDKPVRPSDGERVVFGYVGVPPTYVPQVERDVTGRWRYWTKVGLLVHTGTQAVTISVPQAWRGRVGINFGDSGNRGLPALRFPPCHDSLSNGVWNTFTGSFSFNARDCVPLAVRLGSRSATIRFGLGKRC